MKWCVCESCSGTGKKKTKKNKKGIQKDSIRMEDKSIIVEASPIAPIFKKCKTCDGKGIIPSDDFPTENSVKFPHIAIIGMGIGGLTLAVACLHRGIPFSIFERDNSFNARSQGYGLTLQQASRITKALGIEYFDNGIVSTRHIVHDIEGNVLGTWGKRKWVGEDQSNLSKKTNIHIARQELRWMLLKQLYNSKNIHWGHQFISSTADKTLGNTLQFLVDGELKEIHADIIVGADGIRSSVRNQLFENNHKPLRYLGCLVVLGICSLDKLQYNDTNILDGATVFQTANGNERLYVMPYSKDAIMWQLSFLMDEKEAITLSKKGAQELKKEAIKRTDWHQPIPEIMEATDKDLITGYPVYDREVLENELTSLNQNITLIGDAAHPMSPFKGQGANQAMLDGLSLARHIYSNCKARSFRDTSIRETILNEFEKEMLLRSSVKVKDSALAAEFLHSSDVLHGSDQPRRKISNS